MSSTDLTRRDKGTTFTKVTTVNNTFHLQPFRGFVLEVEDVHFHHDSAVLLPNYPATDQPPPGEPSLGMAVIAKCLTHQNEKPLQKSLIVGHADTSGADPYNINISVKRAKAVMHAVMGEREPWIVIAKGQHKTEDYQLILKWVADVYGWDCDPLGVDNIHGSDTTKAVKGFQKRYNVEFEKNIGVDGVVGHDTWGAFFDVYMDMVQNLCDTDEEGLKKMRAKMNFLGPKVVGCGENWPIEAPQRQNFRSRINRRVEILFFDPGQEPKLDCHPSGTTCTPVLCEIYNLKMYKFTPIPVMPSAPHPIQAFVKLTYIGPEDDDREHIFPPEFPVTVVFKDGSKHNEKVGQGGIAQFGVPRAQSPFTIQFDTPNAFIATAPEGSADANPDRTAKITDLPDLHKQNFRFFKVPAAWTLKESDWTPDTAPHYDAANFNFTLPLGRFGKTMGTSLAPEKLKLDPHWTYLRFEFFDRTFGHANHNHKRINIPAWLIDGFRTTPPAAAADTRCHWAIRDADITKCVHALPWILQFKPDRTAEPKPDTQIHLGFSSEANTFVISDSASARKIEKVTDANKLKPGVDRLKLYDLPAEWKSDKYFTRFTDNTGVFFESITQARLDDSKTADKPLIFSLDDMVLVDFGFNAITLAANEDPVIFFHQFKDPGAGFADKPISPTGVYNPGATLSQTTKPYFPYSDIQMPVRSYISDYPNWTRLVAAQGNLFDVFDKRTRAASGGVIGARAAFRWTDANPAAIGQQANGTLSPRPGRTPSSTVDQFFVIQPCFEQRRDQNREIAKATGVYSEFNSPFSGATFGTGRVDLVLLRDCDVQGGKEVATNLHFFRFQLDFSAAPAPMNVAATQQTFRRDVVNNIPVRWNAPDGAFNAAPPIMKPEDATKPLQVGITWFVQDVPAGRQQFHINVVAINRANMHGGLGTGNFGPGSQSSGPGTAADNGVTYPGWFTGAHECGHGDSLLDEYNERFGLASYMDRAFATWIDGDPYEDDDFAIMMHNQDVRPRHYWHGVEWTRAVSGINFELDHEGGTYKLPHHNNQTAADLRTFVTWPFWADVGVSGAVGGFGERRLFDMYLYALGNESYARKPVAGQDLRGLLMVEVKILLTHDDPNVLFSTIRDTVRDLSRAVNQRFCNKFIISNAIVPGSGVNLSPCLIQFRPRFLVPTFPTNLGNNAEKGQLCNYYNFLGIAGSTCPGADPARTTFLTNTAPGQYGTLVSNSRSNHPEHFKVKVRGSYTTEWETPGLLGSIFGSGPIREMKLRDSAARGVNFAPFFGDMVGLDMSTSPPNDAVLKTRIRDRIVRRAMPSANIS